MTRNHSIPISMRFKKDLLEIIENVADTEYGGNVTETVRQLVIYGLKLKEYEKIMKENPEKQNEIIEEMEQRLKDESYLEHLDNLEVRKKKAIGRHILEDLGLDIPVGLN